MKFRNHVFMSLLWAVLIISLAACQGENTADSSKYPDTIWEKAVSGGGIRAYIKEHQDELDQEALSLAAGDDTISLNGQFKATVLLCELDYQKYMAETDVGSQGDVFAADYPVSAAYANDFLSKAGTDTEAFWEALEPVESSFNYFLNLLAAAGSVSGETLVQLTAGRPEGYSEYESSISKAVWQWLTGNPQHFTESAEALAQAGFFENQEFHELQSQFLDDESIVLEDIDSGLAYIRTIRDTFIPMAEQDFPEDLERIRQTSELLGDVCYRTGLMVSIPDTLELNDEGETAEAIAVEGKKIIAFYHNTRRQEYPDSPAPLRIIGDFMMALSPEQFPETPEAADYWLILTPNYVTGDFYQTSSGSSLQVQEVYSFTAVDLYEAGGRLLRHVGVIKEKPPERTFYRIDNEQLLLQYPSQVSADILTFIYQHINEPETFRYLMEAHSGDQTGLGVGDDAGIGTWEMLLNSYDLVNSFEEGNYRYTPEEGNKFLRCHFTITNHNNKTMSLFPLIYHIGTDLCAVLKDGGGNSYQPLGGVHSSKYFSSTSFAAGESRSGYILFEVPADIAEDGTAISLEFSIKPQNVVYILN